MNTWKINLQKSKIIFSRSLNAYMYVNLCRGERYFNIISANLVTLIDLFASDIIMNDHKFSGY